MAARRIGWVRCPRELKWSMAEKLADIVRAIRGSRVLLVGDLILDRYIYGDAERISPEAPVPVLRTVERREAVGGSANVAACLRALGCQVTCCGVVGQDKRGEQLRDLLLAMGVNTEGILELANRPTTTKTRLIGLAQHRHRQQLMRVDEEDDSPLTSESTTALARNVCQLVSTHDIVCVEDYDKGVISKDLVSALLREASAHSKLVLADPARLADYSRYEGVDVITPNRAELSLVCGKTLDTVEAVGCAGAEVITRFKMASMVATVDSDGAVVVHAGESPQHLSTVPRTVYDNTGAGDAVLAMLAGSLAAGADLMSAARLANVAGGLEVEKFGCVPVGSDEILAEIRLENRRQHGKLISIGDLLGELGRRRDRGESIAFTNGCYDIVHAGHVDFLRRCSAEASTLVVGINSDESVRTLDKGDDRPINTFENRAMVMSAFEFVDYVVRFDEPTPEALIRQIRPNVLLKGADWANKGIVGREFVEAYGGRVVLLPLIEGLSTSMLVERIRRG